jgi:acetylornithine deacetylase/succinyl-diaminopimelate desuccinylase-like protein
MPARGLTLTRLALLLLLPLVAAAGAPGGAAAAPDDVAGDARAWLERLVAVDTASSPGQGAALLSDAARRLRAQGLYAHLHPSGPGRGNLVVRLSSDLAPPSAGPLVVVVPVDGPPVDAQRWHTPPFRLVERDGLLRGRGVAGNKALAAAWLAVLGDAQRRQVRLRREVTLVLTDDGEMVEGSGLAHVLGLFPDLGQGGVALTQGGVAHAGKDGRPLWVGLQRGSKRRADYTLAAYGQAGTTAHPPEDLAVPRLARALDRLAHHRFPPRPSPEAQGAYQVLSTLPLERDARHFAILAQGPQAPGAAQAAQALAEVPEWAWLLRTTCVATHLHGSTRQDSVEPKAKATVRCHLADPDTPSLIAWSLVDVVKDDRVVVERLKGPDPPAPSGPGGEVLEALAHVVTQRWPGVPVAPLVLPAPSHADLLRARGVPAYGVTLFATTADQRLQAAGDDEELGAPAFLAGTLALRDLLLALAEAR